MPFSPDEINRLLDQRIREVAARRAVDSLQDHLERVRQDRPRLMRCLGLEPLPPQTELSVMVTGTIEREGYRVEKIAYRSRPNFSVTAHLYLSSSDKPAPLILRPHGHWLGKKSEPLVQASAIGLALAGYVVFAVDAPGECHEPAGLNERADQGPHNDPWLAMGRAYEGFYVWDLIRGLDYLLTRPEIDGAKIGITGASGGGLASMYAFAVDERIKCAAPVCFGASFEVEPNNRCLCNHVPNILSLGDRADIFALRAPAPVLLVGAVEDPEFPPRGMERTYEKLRNIYKKFDRQARIRLEIVDSGHDYNRRMRESVLAFFNEHLKGGPHRSYTIEARPITDGLLNPAPAETVDRTDESLRVLPFQEHSEATMRSFLEEALQTVGEDLLDLKSRLVPWAKYGRLEGFDFDKTLTLSDDDLRLEKIDQRILTYLGLGVCEAYAQLLHIMLPGGTEEWELSTLGPPGNFVTSLIGSMKTLMDSSSSQMFVQEVVANGPRSSLIAEYLRLRRPTLTVSSTHNFESWIDLYRTQDSILMQPLSIYYNWPFPEARDFSEKSE